MARTGGSSERSFLNTGNADSSSVDIAISKAAYPFSHVYAGEEVVESAIRVVKTLL